MVDENDVALLAGMMGFAIDPAFLPGVTRNLDLLLRQGTLLGNPPLAAEIEPAEAFRP